MHRAIKYHIVGMDHCCTDRVPLRPSMGDAVRGAQAVVAAKTDGPARVERLLVDGDCFNTASVRHRAPAYRTCAS
jgi:hypothetical protein